MLVGIIPGLGEIVSHNTTDARQVESSRDNSSGMVCGRLVVPVEWCPVEITQVVWYVVWLVVQVEKSFHHYVKQNAN